MPFHQSSEIDPAVFAAGIRRFADGLSGEDSAVFAAGDSAVGIFHKVELFRIELKYGFIIQQKIPSKNSPTNEAIAMGKPNRIVQG